jgi:hypothetical protein
MAVSAFIESLLGGVEANLKRVLTEAFRYALPNGRFGPVENQTKSESFSAYYQESTTPSDTSEFSIVHGMGRLPYLAVPVLRIDSSGAMLPVLRVTRPADGQRVYLKCDAGSTSMPFALLVE